MPKNKPRPTKPSAMERFIKSRSGTKVKPRPKTKVKLRPKTKVRVKKTKVRTKKKPVRGRRTVRGSMIA